MAEPVKIKFDYHDPENVESEVPGAQKIREPQIENESREVPEESTTKNGENSQNTNVSNEGLELATNDDFSEEPVIVVTKKETTFTKGDLKLQKVTVTEDISVKYQHLFKKQTLPGKTIVTQENTENGEGVDNVETRHNKRVFSGKRNGIHGAPVMLGEKPEDKKPKTKIPVSKFRQTVERVKAERRLSKEIESHIPVRRSSIPKPVKENKIPSTMAKEITMTKTLIKNDTADVVVTKKVIRSESKESTKTKVTESKTTTEEDEFDKLFADVVNDPQIDVNIDETLLDPKVEDPEKLESKFEEIIHDYEEHKVEPIDVEVVRRSKLPLLKRRSQQDIELSNQAERTSKIIAARDKLRLRHSMNKDENFEKALDEELKKADIYNGSNSTENSTGSIKDPSPIVDTKTETKHEIISSPNSKIETLTQSIKTISSSSSKDEDNNESSSIVQTTIVNEITTNENKDKKEDKKYYITEENIMKDSIRIAMPVFESQIHEFSETNVSAKTVEIKQTMSYTSTSEDLSVLNKIAENNSETSTTTSEANIEHNISKIEKQTSVSEITKDIKTVQVERQSSRLKNVIQENTKTISEPQKSTVIQVEKSTSQDKTNTEKSDKMALKREISTEEVQLRGKVGKLVSKIDSKEVIETEGNERESINELRKKKSVLSKIAMFEKKPEESVYNARPKPESKLPKLITKDWQKTEHIHVHTPLIVDEVFKPFNSETSLSTDSNKDENPLQDVTTIVRAEKVVVESSGIVHYAAENRIEVENKTVEVNPEKIEPVQIPNQKNEDAIHLKPKTKLPKLDLHPKEPNVHDLPTSAITDNYEFKYNANKVQTPTRLSMTKEIQAPVIIPGFKPVRTLLKSFESRNEENELKYVQRSISKDQTKTFTRKVSETNNENKVLTAQISKIESYTSEAYDGFDSAKDYKSLDDVFTKESEFERLKLRQEDDLKRAQSLAELDLGDAFKGKVNSMILRMKSVDRTEIERREIIKKEMPRKRSVSEKIALFEGKLTPTKSETPAPLRIFKTEKTTENVLQNNDHKPHKIDIKTIEPTKNTEIKKVDIRREKSVTEIIEKNLTEVSKIEIDEEVIKKKIEELKNAKFKYGRVEDMPEIELSNGVVMPILAVGTALLDPRLTYHIVCAAIDLGYRAIDTAYIYGTEKQVGEAIREKIADGTVKREDLFIMSKLWSTYHRTDLVEGACKASLEAMGLEYFDLYLIHNPMSFKEGAGPLPKIATVLQYSEFDYLDAWYGMEKLVAKGLVRAIGVSNFNSLQLQRVLDKGKIKPVVNQVECHPYLSQQRLDLFCSERNVTLSCFGVLGSKGTPLELKNGQPAVIDDALIQVMASGLGITPAQLLISYQLENGHGVVVKASSAHHLHDNLLALGIRLTTVQVDALHALNRNKRMFTYRGMGDTHKNYPFHAAF